MRAHGRQLERDLSWVHAPSDGQHTVSASQPRPALCGRFGAAHLAAVQDRRDVLVLLAVVVVAARAAVAVVVVRPRRLALALARRAVRAVRAVRVLRAVRAVRGRVACAAGFVRRGPRGRRRRGGRVVQGSAQRPGRLVRQALRLHRAVLSPLPQRTERGPVGPTPATACRRVQWRGPSVRDVLTMDWLIPLADRAQADGFGCYSSCTHSGPLSPLSTIVG